MNITLTGDEYAHIVALLEKEHDGYSVELADKLFICYHYISKPPVRISSPKTMSTGNPAASE